MHQFHEPREKLGTLFATHARHVTYTRPEAFGELSERVVTGSGQHGPGVPEALSVDRADRGVVVESLQLLTGQTHVVELKVSGFPIGIPIRPPWCAHGCEGIESTQRLLALRRLKPCDKVDQVFQVAYTV